MKKFLAAIAVVGLLSACGTAAKPGADATPAVGSNRPVATSEAPVADVIPEPEPEVTTEEPAEEINEPVAFGSTKTYTDGLQITVSKGRSFRPSDTSAGSEGFKVFRKFTVTIVNGTGKTFDPSMVMVSAQSANIEAAEIFDSEQDLGSSPSTKLLKGRESKYAVGFGVTDAKDVVLEITPGFEYDSALFN